MMRHVKHFLVGLLLTVLGTAALAQSEYRVKPGDSLVVEVLEDNSLNRSVVVLPDGTINFPFAGSVQAAGRNASEIQSALTSGIQSNFSNPPTVFVSIQPALQNTVPSGGGTRTLDIYFLGEVNAPGLVEVKRGTTLLQAMAVAGGVTRFAAIKRVQLRRTDKAGVQNVITVNYKDLANGTASNAIELKDGDVILVPERRLFE